MADIPGEAPYPLGVYHHRPPAEAAYIKSYDLGGSVPVRVLRTATTAANDALRAFNNLNPIP